MDEKYALIVKIALIVVGIAFLIFLIRTVLPLAIAIAAGIFIYKFICYIINRAKYKGD